MSSGVLPRVWQRRGVCAWLLLPLAGLFSGLVALRRGAYRRGWLRSERLPVPVVVVGNILVGGSGKTPLTLWLAQGLQAAGWTPGIVSRGYGSDGGCDGNGAVRAVHADSRATDVGDEPLLLRRRSGLPVFVGTDRVAAARALLVAHPECDLLLCDDGLQHYRLARDVEIAVLDARGALNGWLLPAGPLRESTARLTEVDALVLNGNGVDTAVPSLPLLSSVVRPVFRMTLLGATFQRLDDPQQTCTAAGFGGLRLAALAGIGVPERFFAHLERLGLQFDRHAFPDHHRFTPEDLSAIEADALLMTEKDAVKCAGFSRHPIWVLPVSAQVESLDSGASVDLVARVEHCIEEKSLGRPSA